MKRISKIFFQGLVAVLPLTVTVLVLVWLGGLAERTLGAGVRRVLPEGVYVPGMGVLAGLGLTFLLGLLVKAWGMRKLIGLGEKLIGHIPLVKTIYGAVRDMLGFFGSSGEQGARDKAVLVSLGESGIRVPGLLTRESMDELPEGLRSEGHVVVYVPFSYQIGGGCTLVVPRERVQPIDMPLDEAMRFIVTAGVTTEARGAAMV